MRREFDVDQQGRPVITCKCGAWKWSYAISDWATNPRKTPDGRIAWSGGRSRQDVEGRTVCSCGDRLLPGARIGKPLGGEPER